MISAGEALDDVVQDEAERAFLLDAGSRYAVYRTWAAIKPGQAVSDMNGGREGFVGIKVDPDRPAPTVSKMIASVVSVFGPMHWSERRKFTVPELKRLCSFPDQFKFPCGREGAAAAMGNSVLPMFMARVADALRGVVA